jgi:hypothetical protein
MRTTEADVKAIIDTALTEDELNPFLTAANVLVSAVVGNEGYTEQHLREIERWLAAHLIAIRDPRLMSQKIGDADAVYAGFAQFGKGLEFTSYGQQVLLLDTHARFAALQNAKRPIEVKVIC